MKLNSQYCFRILSSLAVLVLLPLQVASAQQDKVAAFKQSLAANQKRLMQYRWIETTVINMKGDEKSRVQKECFYGADGKVQKQQIFAPAPQQASGGRLRERIVERKKQEITEYMQSAVTLMHAYVPPNPQLMQAAADAGKLSVSPGGGAVGLEFRDFLKSGDQFSVTIDGQNGAIQQVSVKSYLDSPKDAISLEVTFAMLQDGVNYPANIVLLAPEKKIQVVVQNGGYRRQTSANEFERLFDEPRHNGRMRESTLPHAASGH